jgi:hypothetical protein
MAVQQNGQLSRNACKICWTLPIQEERSTLACCVPSLFGRQVLAGFRAYWPVLKNAVAGFALRN